MRSEFGKDTKKCAYTFGVSRDCFKKVFLAENPPRDFSIPGPGSYKEKDGVGKEGERYTMRPRTRILLILSFIPIVVECKRLSVPGPGTYQAPEALTKDGKFFLSRFRDSGACALRSTAQRWTQQDKRLAARVPGPGKYECPSTINSLGRNFVSRFESSQTRKFGSARRGSSLEFSTGTFP